MSDTLRKTPEDALETADTKFAPTVPPQADFLVAWSTRDDGFAGFPGCEGFVGVEAGRSVRLYSNAAEIAALKPGETFLLGSAKIDRRIALGPKVLASSSVPESAPIGQCTLIERMSHSIRVRSDYFGMCPLFYFESGNLSLLSNRFHLICLALRAAGRLEVDIHAWRAMFYTNDAFSYQLATVQTPAKGVRMSLHTMSFRLSDERGLEIKNSPTQQPTGVLTPSEYRSLIRQAAEEIASNLDAALQSFCGRNVMMHITGGRDSRVNLAALLSLGKLDSVTFRTANRGRDVEIARKLVRHFGGSYSAPHDSTPSEVIDIPFPLLMEQRRSKFFGLYHHVDLRRNSRHVLKRKLVTVMGGCGELYRSFYQKKNAFSRLDFDRIGDAKEIESAVKRCGHWRKLFDKGEFRGAEDEIVDSFLSFSPGTVDQRLNEHYRQIRSRMHFGVTKMSFSDDNLTWMPLMSRSLLDAAMGLPFEERNSGRAVFDVTKELCEALAYLPYESPNPDFALSPYHWTSVFDDRPPHLNNTSEGNPARRKAMKASPRGWMSRHVNAWTVEQKIDYMSTNAVRALDSLEARYSILGGHSRSSIANRLSHVGTSNPRSIQYLYSKLSGMRDIARLSG